MHASHMANARYTHLTKYYKTAIVGFVPQPTLCSLFRLKGEGLSSGNAILKSAQLHLLPTKIKEPSHDTPTQERSRAGSWSTRFH